MRNALLPGPGRGNFPREILIETIAETGVRQNIVERSSEMCLSEAKYFKEKVFVLTVDSKINFRYSPSSLNFFDLH